MSLADRTLPAPPAPGGTEPALVAPVTLPPGRMVELAGRGAMFVRELAGPPAPEATLVLLHGLGANADLNWFPAYGPLGARYRVLAVDHRGHGRGIRTPEPFRLADCADDVAALCDHLGLGTVVPVGYSMGGPIAQLLWHRHRPLVAGLVLCATARYFTGRHWRRFFRATLPGIFTLLEAAPPAGRGPLRARLLERRLGDDPLDRWIRAELERNDHRLVMGAARAVATFSSRTWAGEIDVPTAVVVMDRDRLVPVRRQLGLAAAIPGATVHRADSDHLDCAIDPDCFVDALADAVASVVARHR